MKLAISNIAWADEYDEVVYGMMKQFGYTGLEIAPTRIFPQNPYEQLSEAAGWAKALKAEQEFCVPSMQSIWYGRTERLFGSEEERRALLDYTKKAIRFAAAIGCKNLVFGCPKNRNLPEGADPEIATAFFRELGEYALAEGTVIGMEANPTIYNTNYINDTLAALELIRRVDSQGFRLNLDLGTMIQNGEDIGLLTGQVKYINHVHISEPGLKPIEIRPIHEELKELLLKENYQGYVSIEMGKTEERTLLENIMLYMKCVFE